MRRDSPDIEIERLRTLAARHEKYRVEQSNESEHAAPPDIRVKVKKHDRVRGRMKNFPHPGAANQYAVHEQRNTDKKPNRNAAFVTHAHRLFTADSTLERGTKFAF
jgi:hypothetical protein